MQKAIKAVGVEVAQNAHVMCGQGGHVIMYPIDFGKTFNMVATTYSHKTWDKDQWVVPVEPSEILDDFKGWDSRVTNILGVSSLSKPSTLSVKLTISVGVGAPSCLVYVGPPTSSILQQRPRLHDRRCRPRFDALPRPGGGPSI